MSRLMFLFATVVPCLAWAQRVTVDHVTASQVEFHDDGAGCPTTGVYAAGMVRLGSDGALCVCTVGGEPGTWINVASFAGAPTEAQVRSALAAATAAVDFNAQNLTDVGTVDGRDVSADGTKLDGIEALADVTDAANVAAAGAVMSSLYDANSILAATADNTPAAVTVAASTVVGRGAAGGIDDISGTTLAPIVSSALNVNAAAMDIELVDNSLTAFRAIQGANEYLWVSTFDAGPGVVLGNLTTDPAVTLNTNGLVTASLGTLDVPDGADFLVGGATMPATWTAANFADLTDGGETTLHTHPSSGGFLTATVSIPGGTGAGTVGGLNTFPQTVIAAAGADTVIVPLTVHYWLDFATAAYDNVGTAEKLTLRYSGGSQDLTAGFDPTGFANVSNDEHRIDYPDIESSGEAEAFENTAVVVRLPGTWYSAAGDSPLIVSVKYITIDYTPSPP